MVVDTNVLLYAANSRARHHEASVQWLEGALSGERTVMFPWVVLLGFLRLSTSRAALSQPIEIDRALEFVEDWLAAAPAVIVEPGAEHLRRVAELLTPAGSGGNLVNDAHLAAIALEHNVPMVSFDTDFDRFPGLERIQPTLA